MASIKKERVGEMYNTKEGYVATIIYSKNYKNCDIQLNDDKKTIIKNLEYHQIVKGSIKNPFHPLVYNIGYIGKGNYKSSVYKKQTRAYTAWKNMFKRCYDEKTSLKKPTYKDCSVDKRWHNFQIFAKWFEDNYIDGYDLDKDIIQKGNKIYSPETCCFVPQEINKLFNKSKKSESETPVGVRKKRNKFEATVSKGGGIPIYLGTFDSIEEAFQAYKKAKEHHLHKLAISYYATGKIPLKVYEALRDYKVEITD